jgi:hypothetical protein
MDLKFNIGDHVYVIHEETADIVEYAHHGIVMSVQPLLIAHGRINKLFYLSDIQGFLNGGSIYNLGIVKYNATNEEVENNFPGTFYRESSLSRHEIIKNAKKLLYKRVEYDLLTLNCENLVYFCTTGKKTFLSTQTQYLLKKTFTFVFEKTIGISGYVKNAFIDLFYNI